MRMLRTIWLGALAASILVVSQPAAAKDIQSGLGPKVALLETAITTGDYGKALDVLPPRLIQTMSERFGMTVDELRQAATEASANVLDGVEGLSFSMQVDQATNHLTPDGQRPYWLVPTATQMSVDGRGMRTTTQTLAFEEDGEWYLIRVVEPAQVAMLREVYPEFAGVEFPRGSVTAVE